MSNLTKIKMRRHGCLRFILLTAVTLFVLFFALDAGRDALLEFIYPIKYSHVVEKRCEEFGLDKYLVYAVIRTESKFKEDALSDAGAKGLMQLMDETAKECNEKGSFSYNIPEDILKPEVNITLGCYYLSKLIDYYDGDISLAITAYNGGTGNVGKWLKDSELSDGDGGLIDIPFEETKGYVDKVLSAYDKYKEIYTEN